jgi:demethylmenaquinone methyltransferase/2-methoxy-6-polyprenyl-1,4-benzoquinol methylase
MTAAASVRSMGEYYARRAQSYERVYYKPERQAELRLMEAYLAEPFAGRRVLEIACGTGWWTPHGARRAASWLATDLNPETMAVARHKPLPGCVRFAEVDAYTLEGLDGQPFDAAFAGFWWSHVPLSRLKPWLQQLHQRLDPGARVVFIDNRYVPGSSTALSRRDAQGNIYQLRALDDGTQHEVVKNFPTADEAIACLGPQARDVAWTEHPHYWVLSYRLS